MAFTTLTTTQKTFLESHLRGTGKSLSAAQARETYGIMNLRARVSELRSAGLNIRKVVNTNGRNAYTIARRDVAGAQGRIFA